MGKIIEFIFPTFKDDTDEIREGRRLLRWTSLFMGDVRDGITMINMQNAFLCVAKQYTEKQSGILFFVFGISQFTFQTLAGYLYDYTDSKISWLGTAAIGTSAMTIATAALAAPNGENLKLVIVLKFLQGAASSFLLPGINSITQGVVGASGMTGQVPVNRMMNHAGSVIIAFSSALVAFFLYPRIGLIFVVSPLSVVGVLYFLCKLDPNSIDHNEARGLTIQQKQSRDSFSTGYRAPSPSSSIGSLEDPAVSMKSAGEKIKKGFGKTPSFNFGCMDGSAVGGIWGDGETALEPDSPLRVLCDPILLLFLFIVFTFHLANFTVLPLVMQTLAIGSGREGMMLAGLCMVISQFFMATSAKLCGYFSKFYGRKPLFLVGFISLPLRCWLLSLLLKIRGDDENNVGEGTNFGFLNVLILSTQVLGGVGLGIFGTMYILVTSDISGGTGRFSMTLGMTTAAMSVGCTVSGYVGEALAEDLGYRHVFALLSLVALVPLVLYLFLMPETIPPILKEQQEQQLSTISPIPEVDIETDDSPKKSAAEYGIMA